LKSKSTTPERLNSSTCVTDLIRNLASPTYDKICLWSRSVHLCQKKRSRWGSCGPSFYEPEEAIKSVRSSRMQFFCQISETRRCRKLCASIVGLSGRKCRRQYRDVSSFLCWRVYHARRYFQYFMDPHRLIGVKHSPFQYNETLGRSKK